MSTTAETLKLPDRRRLGWSLLPDRWSLLAALLALAVTFPILVVFSTLFVPQGYVWHHLATNVLPQYIINTVALTTGVAIGVTVIGVGCFETLAIRVYTFAPDERLAEASTAALAIVAVGLVPVIVLSRIIARSRPRRGRLS
ncbi:MAG: hypothetical protein AAGA73_22965 [Pseudomonadota bacterium]